MPTKRKGIPALPDLNGPAEIKRAADKLPTVTLAMAQGLIGFVQVTLKTLPWTRDDALDELEQEILAKDIVEFARVNPWFARGIVYVYQAMRASGLPSDALAVTAKRLARHQLVGPEFELIGDVALAASAERHKLDLPEGFVSIGSLFGGLGGDETETAPDAAPDPSSNGATPDLVTMDLSE